jgi:dihydropteridine reductase
MASKCALVIGASGALGRSLYTCIASKTLVWSHVVTADTHAGWSAPSAQIHHTHISLDPLLSLRDNYNEFQKALPKGIIFDAIYCVAGGFSMGSAGKGTNPEAFLDVAQEMINKNIYSSLLATSIAMKNLNPSGILVLTGSEAALHPTPSMIQYGMSKNAIHNLVTSLSSAQGHEKPSSKGFQSKAVAILPTILDTPTNRKDMPKADRSMWIPTLDLAELLVSWGQDHSSTVPGGLYVVEMAKKSPENGGTKPFLQFRQVS